MSILKSTSVFSSLLLLVLYFVLSTSYEFRDVKFNNSSSCYVTKHQNFTTTTSLFYHTKTLKGFHHFNNTVSKTCNTLWLYVLSTHKIFSSILGFPGEGPGDNKNKKRKCYCSTYSCNGQFINRRLQAKHKKHDDAIKNAGIAFSKTAHDARNLQNEDIPSAM